MAKIFKDFPEGCSAGGKEPGRWWSFRAVGDIALRRALKIFCSVCCKEVVVVRQRTVDDCGSQEHNLF